MILIINDVSGGLRASGRRLPCLRLGRERRGSAGPGRYDANTSPRMRAFFANTGR